MQKRFGKFDSDMKVIRGEKLGKSEESAKEGKTEEKSSKFDDEEQVEAASDWWIWVLFKIWFVTI